MMMATNLPTKDQCETWSPTQVASFLSQNGMRESSEIVTSMRIDGHWLLNMTSRDLSRFNLIHQPQIQKMVQDIKKNDGSIMNRLKRFQNEQAAFIRKTGKNTWDRLKSKPPPKVPVRDYSPDDDMDGDQLSESEFDSDTYEDPLENQDDSYEPPPCERGNRAFASPSATSYNESEYLDHQDSQLNKPARPLHKPLPSSERPAFQPNKQDEDYITPEDEDNYIDPSEKAVSESSSVNCGAKSKERIPPVTTGPPDRSPSPDVYEVPDPEETSQNRPSIPLRVPTVAGPPVASPRILSKKPSPSPEAKDGKHDLRDKDEGRSMKQDGSAVTSPKAPVPQPRELKHSSVPQKQKPVIQNIESEESEAQQELAVPSSKFGIIRSSTVQESGSLRPTTGRGTQRSNADDRDAGVYQKAWYAGVCDRKTAEAALTRANVDGSFLVRQSSGQDPQQPYTLVVFYRKRAYNIPVRFIPSSRQYALGKEKIGEERFSSVSSIIENHQRNVLVLVDTQNNTKDCTKLQQAVEL